MALDVAEFLWNKFLKSLAELESESRSGFVTITLFNSSIKDVVSKFKEIKDVVNERDIMRQRYTYSETIDRFYELNDALNECRVIVHECKEIKNKLSSINPGRFISLTKMNDKLKKIKDELQKLEPSRQEIDNSLTMTGPPMLPSEVFGFDAKSKKIEELLLEDSGSSSTGVTFTKIAVIGMAGVGKTTLVQKVLGSKKVKDKFSRIIWIPFSGTSEGEQISRFNFETCIRDDFGTPERIVGLDSLLKTLHKQISDQCYLIVLDDVCFQVINIMERLVSGLPKASGGAVIVTSRLPEVAQKLGEHYRFFRVKHLTQKDCSSIFDETIKDENKLPSISPEDTSRMEEMKVQCHGLPLLAKALAQIFPKEHVSSQEMSQSAEVDYVPSSADQPKLGAEEMIDKSDALKNIRRSYGDLQGTELKVCLLSLSIFPEGSVIRKRPLIYWWIGEGFITATKEKTAEEIGEDIFAKLLRKDLIQPDPDESNCASLVKNCRVHPWIRRMLISLAREARLFDFNPKWPIMMPSESCRRSRLVSNEETHQGDDQLKNLLTVFNVNVQYLDLKQEWLDKLKGVEVLHFGRWQSSPRYHIEVDHKTFDGSQAVGFLNGLGAQKHLKYLSLRGISRISVLPASICSLISLEILDLRACHDLERLPSDISSLKKLTHLDVAECYLLEGMPKGLHRLSSLQVLKGFLIGSEEKTPLKLGDLAKLKYLRRLSIHIGSEAALQPGEFGKLKDMSSLLYLKKSWGVDSGDEFKALSFPPNLEKLDLQGFPLSTAPDGLKPSKLKNLKRLYIRGGKLGSLEHMNEKPVQHEEPVQWKVEILRLKYLEELRTDSAEEVDRIFPHLKYMAVDEKKLIKAEG